MNFILPDHKSEDKNPIITLLIEQNVYKHRDGRQLYELSKEELLETLEKHTS